MGASKEVFTQMREQSLFSINQHQQELMFRIEELDGELTLEIESKINCLFRGDKSKRSIKLCNRC